MLRNASIPIITISALEIANLLAGAVIVETVFAWPGLGQLAIQSIAARDFPIVQAIVLLAAFTCRRAQPPGRHPLQRGRSAHPPRRRPMSGAALTAELAAPARGRVAAAVPAGLLLLFVLLAVGALLAPRARRSRAAILLARLSPPGTRSA